MKKHIVAIVVLVIAAAACGANTDARKLGNGSAGVKSMGEGSFYAGAQDWEAKAADLYKIQQPTK